MSEFTLNIYGENDEIIKTYETNFIRWKLFIKALQLKNEIEGLTVDKQLEALGDLMKAIFIGLTDEELEMADAIDIFNTFGMILAKADNIEDIEKNVKAAQQAKK